MSVDVATLEIRVLSEGVAKANQRLDALEKQGKKAERATDGLGTSFKNLTSMATGFLLPLGLIGTALAAMNKLVTVTRDFGKLEAMLKTATGSAERAAIAFKGVQEFASNTPYDLQQATTAFLKLVNYGLTPSREALMAYGDFASSMGKPLVDMIEAVADATTGEMERLKEFGVKAKQEGDKVSFTFRGVTETVGRNSKEIEEYLIRLAQKNFGGAMAEQMKTLDGTLANLSDSWDMLFKNISDAGVGDAIRESVQVALDAVNELNARIASGQMGAEMNANVEMWSKSWRELAVHAENALNDISREVDVDSKYWGEIGSAAVDVMIEAWDYFPANIKATMEIVGTILYGLVESGRIAASTAVDVMINEFKRLGEISRQISVNAAEGLVGGGAESSLEAKINLTNKLYSQQRDKILKAGGAELDTLINQGTSSIETALDERTATIEEKNAAMGKALELRKKYEAELLSGKGVDTLKQFRVGGDAPASAGGGAGGGGKGGKAGVDKSVKEFENLMKQLQKEEVAIESSYTKRIALIERHTEAGSALQEEASNRVLEMASEEFSELASKRQRDGEEFESVLEQQERLLEEHYQRRREIILTNEQLTGEEKNALIKRLEEQRLQAQSAAENAAENEKEERRQKAYKTTADFFGNLSAMAGAFGKKGFKTMKALAIVEATINTANAAIAAYKSLADIKYVGPVLGAAAAGAAIAYGSQQVAAIKAQEYTGAYEHGGMIPAGGVGMVGEAGAELVRGPAMVTSARTTADSHTGSSSASPVVNVIINNLPGQTSEVTERTNSLGERELLIITKKVEGKLTGDVQSGGGQFVPALQKRFGLNRQPS